MVGHSICLRESNTSACVTGAGNTSQLVFAQRADRALLRRSMTRARLNGCVHVRCEYEHVVSRSRFPKEEFVALSPVLT